MFHTHCGGAFISTSARIEAQPVSRVIKVAITLPRVAVRFIRVSFPQ
jgi:hypothetical protein